MSNLELNLIVVTDHLGDLAARQQTAADKILGSNRLTVDVSAQIESTHGVICYLTAMAVSKGEAARRTAGETMQRVSTEFSEKLTTASTNYNNVDYREGRTLDDACQV